MPPELPNSSGEIMLPKEIVLRAIEFRDPPRVPVSYCNRDFDSSDTLATGYAPAADFVPCEPGMTEWGYVWHSLDMTMGQPSTHPLADDGAVDAYRPPDPCAPGRLDALPAFIAQNSDRFLRFGLGITGFNTATFLRGFDQYLIDLHTDRPLAERILDYVIDFETGMIDQAVRAPVDAVAFGDDWGTQRGLMIAPALWRAVFRPRYADQFARIHRAGKKVWFHTCGDVRAIIGDLIDIGVDVIELLQPDIFGVEWLAREFGGKVCFCCSVDHQRRAVSGTRDEIFAYARQLNDMLGAFHGGFIGYVEDYASLGMSEQNYQWIRQAFHGLGAAMG
jgi:uroporphyrinogen decarboxylase